MRKILTTLSIVSLTYISAATLTTDKPTYATTDTVKVNFSEMDNHSKDWIAIYPKGSSTAWKNVVKWAWTENKSEGILTFKNLPAGDYEVRGFYNNSYNAEVTKAFKVEGNGAKAELSPTHPVFHASEDVRINFKNINGATNDWLAIYPADSNNDWGNVIKWKFNKGGVKSGQANFDKLAPGRYEARVFYNNTFKMEAKVPFRVDGFVPGNATLSTPNPAYFKDQPVTLNFNNLSKDATIVIYVPWDNKIIASKKISNQTKGTVRFEGLPYGYYEARVFYNGEKSKVIAKQDLTIVSKNRSDDLRGMYINRSTKTCEVDDRLDAPRPDFIVFSSNNDMGGQYMTDWYIYDGRAIRDIKSFHTTAHNYAQIMQVKKGNKEFKMIKEYWKSGGRESTVKYYRVDSTNKLIEVSAEDARECI